jgi:hypothetical protein
MLEQRFDGIDRPFDAGAVAARRGEEDTGDHRLRQA